ncbi:MAG: PTS system mannose/fructose/sorbose family transporter subunit IID [Endomicrobium sp.]|jgi:PTS system mannose-specific IID component|uniref:PTS system mannose/fructose/sorbose family transporter subunit IID n=1 Tax=Candidatus Endomicrobiellum cubanum TaxID=3242325 RepID=UPI002831D9A9|nr:PTS system mannose/fructose/sorbose family transporter subunit IID [Endomicrobium sp.]
MIKLYFRLLIRSFFLQSLWNYERLQNIGFVFILHPLFDKIYTLEKEKKEAFLRHIGYFNTQVYMAGMIVGIIANMEKEIAKLKPAKRNEMIDKMNRVKSNMAGPLAAIGEPFFYGELRPMLSFLSIFIMVTFANRRSGFIVLSPIIFILIYNFFHLKIRICFLYEGFKYCTDSVKFLINFKSMSDTVHFGFFVTFLAAFSLYLAVFSFSSEGKLFYSGYTDFFIYISTFLFSFFVSNKFGTMASIFSVLAACIIMSLLGI